MASTGVRIIKRPSPPEVRIKVIRDAVIEEMKKVAKQHVRERERVVANFSHKIEFEATAQVGPEILAVYVQVKNKNEKLNDTGKATIGDLWKWLSKTGTKRHKIRAKKKIGKSKVPRLFFVTGGPGSYQPKTSPKGKFGGPGTVRNGKPTAPQEVNHPGFPPRLFDEVINARLNPQFNKAIGRGLNKGFRRLKSKK